MAYFAREPSLLRLSVSFLQTRLDVIAGGHYFVFGRVVFRDARRERLMLTIRVNFEIAELGNGMYLEFDIVIRPEEERNRVSFEA
jgi:hypothetical protein